MDGSTGETIVVPEFWWHATCNLDPYTIGVGGQLWRAGMTNTFEAAGERTVPLVIKESYDSSSDMRDVPLPDVIEPIVFDPAEVEEEDADGPTVGVAVSSAGRAHLAG